MARRSGILLVGIVIASLAGAADSVAQQGPGLVELRRLISQREPEITRLEARQRALEARGDSLSQVKRRTPAGSDQFETVSNQIRETGDQLIRVARDLRTLYEQMRDLKTKLYLAYNDAVAETKQRIDRLPPTPENRAELTRLTETLLEYFRARDQLQAEVEEAQDDLFLPDLVLDPTDGPSQLRVKEAIARDAVDMIDQRIESIREQIETLNRKERDRQEMQRLKEDFALWGDQQGINAENLIDQILEGRGLGRGAPGEIFSDPNERIRSLQLRLLDLRDRRQEYSAKATAFADRLKAFYH